MLAALEEQRARVQPAIAQVTDRHQKVIDQYRYVAGRALREGIEALRQNVSEASGGNPFCEEILHRTSDYLQWLTWTLWDLPHFAAAIRPDPERFRELLKGASLLYFSGRVLDDYLDRHFLYRDRRATLLASLREEQKPSSESEALTIIVALLLCFEGLDQLSGCATHNAIQTAVQSTRRLLIGILMERSQPETWTEEFYERLIRLKNVDYWHILYVALDPERASPLYPFLTAYYALAQKVNDVQSYARDEAQGRPNLVSIFRLQVEGETSVMEAAAAIIGGDLLQLGGCAEQLPEPERCLAFAKLAETHDEAVRLGLFPTGPVEQEPAKRSRLGLIWHSTLEEFVDRAGPDALEIVRCPVCFGSSAVGLFRKHGFLFNRCHTCSHIYVSPRLRSSLQTQLATELDGTMDDPFSQTQKIYAEYLCRVLRRHAPGPRLLDIGFGAGFLLQMARAYGFQVYGVEGSRSLTEELRPLLGRRLVQMHVDDGELPWGSFDVIAMSHVIEHIAEPRKLLPRIANALNPSGLFYIAVPDSESLQFRLFGKNWDAVNPVAHYQFFNESSLSRLLRDCGFEPLKRVRMPPLGGELEQRWMRMFRRLGGDESGELALLARRTALASSA
jgi:SAM-dependent methyltransferase